MTGHARVFWWLPCRIKMMSWQKVAEAASCDPERYGASKSAIGEHRQPKCRQKPHQCLSFVAASDSLAGRCNVLFHALKFASRA